MKNLLVLIACFLTLTVCSQEKEKIEWLDFEEAVAKAKKNPKKIFVDLYTDWCSWCKVMDNTTFSDSTIIDYMNNTFYCVKFDAERSDTIHFSGYDFVNPNAGTKRSTHQLAAAMLQGKMSYPSFVFFNENQVIITAVPGYHKPEQFEVILNYIGSDAILNMPMEDFMKEFRPTKALKDDENSKNDSIK